MGTFDKGSDRPLDRLVAVESKLDAPTKQLVQIAALFCHWLAEHDERHEQMADACHALTVGLEIAAAPDDKDRTGKPMEPAFRYERDPMTKPGDLMTDARTPTGGAGPLYPQTPAAMAAAERPVEIPGSDAETPDRDVLDSSTTDNPTGERQAAENRDNEPPA